jgi:hypothetical protein
VGRRGGGRSAVVEHMWVGAISDSDARWPNRIRGKRRWLVVVIRSLRLVVVGRWWSDPLFSSSGSLPAVSLRWNRVLPVVIR